MKMSKADLSEDGGRGEDGEPSEVKKYPDYCRAISFTDTNGVVRELVFPKALDLDRPKRARTTFSRDQLERLEAEFSANQYMVGRERSQLARTLGLSETQVKVWFQNRRTKHKRDREKQDGMREANAESMATKSLLHILRSSQSSPASQSQAFGYSNPQIQLSAEHNTLNQQPPETSKQLEGFNVPKTLLLKPPPLHKDLPGLAETAAQTPGSGISVSLHQRGVNSLPSTILPSSSVSVPILSSSVLGVGTDVGLYTGANRSHGHYKPYYGMSSNHRRVQEAWFSDPYAGCHSSLMATHPAAVVHTASFPAVWPVRAQSSFMTSSSAVGF